MKNKSDTGQACTNEFRDSGDGALRGEAARQAFIARLRDVPVEELATVVGGIAGSVASVAAVSTSLATVRAAALAGHFTLIA